MSAITLYRLAPTTYTRILPLCLGGQTELLTAKGIELTDKQLDVATAYISYRLVSIVLVLRRVHAHYSLPQCLGYFVLTQIVTV